MRFRGMVLCGWAMSLTGCLPPYLMPEEPATQQVASSLQEPRKPMPTRVNYPPAAQDVSLRVLLMKDCLIGKNPQVALKPYINAIASPDPEIFHVGLNQIFITDSMVRQCRSDGQLAAVIANELGVMISEREASVSDDVRKPDRLPPARLPIGGGFNANEVDPIHRIEMARYEKQYPRHGAKLARPNPQQVARDILDHAGYQTTELDAAWPVLQNAERYRSLQNQFNGTVQQGNWKTP